MISDFAEALGEWARQTGFRLAADVLYAQMTTSGSIRDLDTLVYPYANCWRHYVELHLKEIHPVLQELLDLPRQRVHGHKIDKLWNDVSSMLKMLWPDETTDLAHVDRIIQQFAEMDADGQGFRYARDTKGVVTLKGVNHIDLSTFHAALAALSNFLSGAEAQADHELDLKREMEAEYRPDF